VIIGGVHTVSATPTVLSSDTTPCRAITIRLRSNAVGDIYVGDADMTGQDDAFAFVEPGESFGYQSFLPASGMRPTEIYIVGTVGDKLHWSAWVS
jgi:hypothetical protein